MKLLLMTFHTPINYGALLQATALYRIICRYADDVQVIDYNSSEMQRSYPILYRIKHWKDIYWFALTLLNLFSFLRKHKRFDRFQRENLQLTKRYPDLQSLYTDPPTCDLCLTGSDQVFHPTRQDKAAFFLDFLPRKCLRAAYAPSFGIAQIPKAQKELITSYVKSFSALSARETQGAEILRDLLQRPVSTVLDPVFLLLPEQWNRLSSVPTHLPKKYLLCYALHGQEKLALQVNRLKELTGLPVIVVAGTIRTKIRADRNIWDAGPAEFLALFQHAEYVVTDSFHGLAFSLIYRKPFFIYITGSETAGRLTSLLTQLNLTSRIYNDKSIQAEDLTMDYSSTIISLEKLRQESLTYLVETIQPGIRLADRDQCYGCTACAAVCPVNAIILHKDSEGFIFPKIDASKCIQCNKCRRACPVISPPAPINEVKRPWVCYGRNRNRDIQLSSSSGGMFAALAQSILARNGVVFGAVFDPGQGKVLHASSDEVDWQLMKKSKYVQSELGDCFHQAANALHAGREVLFSGTPCQILGLYGFLGEHPKNLLTVDFICHGVSSPAVLSCELAYLTQKYHSQVKIIDFRPKNPKNKNLSWGNAYFKAVFADGRTFYRNWRFDFFYASFIDALSLRKSCFTCPCAEEPHLADVTLADFWHYSKVDSRLYDPNGLSIIYLNTLKGRELFEKLSSELSITRLGEEYAQFACCAHNFSRITRDHFFQDFIRLGYRCARRYHLYQPLTVVIKTAIKKLLHRFP